jgi:hypothetical protein
MATYYSGKMGSIAIDGFVFPLDTWELNSTAQTPEVSNFVVSNLALGGQQAFIPNLLGGEIRASGPLTSLGTTNAGYIPGRPTAGNYATFTLGVGPGLFYTIVALIQEVNPSQDVQSNAKVEYVAVITPNPNT